MAGRQTIKGQVAVEYLKKYPNLPILTIAKKLHKDHPKLFPAVESTRTILREYAGKIGNEKAPTGGGRRTNPDKYGTRRPKGVSGGDAWEALMPESLAEDFKPWILPSSIKRLAVIGDLHIPHHNVEALKLTIRHCQKENPDAILLNGDTMDFYALSFHEKDPRRVNWLGELEAGRQAMRMLRSAFPNIPIIYKAGNHCIRLERHLQKYAPILLGMEEFELPVLLRLGETGVQYVENKVNIWAGKLNIIHGDEYRGAGGVNPARWLSLRTGENSMCSHFHRTSSHMDRTIRHDIRGWWSLGCMCELTPLWLPYNQWNLGFAIVHLNPDQSFEVENMTIVNGKVR